ncbi:Ubiquitin carboxyl-terminal hydrolase [Carpediemonas membranifera]|uniref:Ubiquitin carboxyl-terminal hydrolase n=1 Tax=Carpediemonas membranifera TaxID=201153 RepID=A0A8J6AUG0_9EUKA|nr:Ubiquitin carboxyl-terminal hydrolase [Carpediemonas membranifera]|eukprot:KAG9395026.1 Ubiquitin carboxyl-terminal hydrolase [Carpediemonas membranifera]
MVGALDLLPWDRSMAPAAAIQHYITLFTYRCQQIAASPPPTQEEFELLDTILAEAIAHKRQYEQLIITLISAVTQYHMLLLPNDLALAHLADFIASNRNSGVPRAMPPLFKVVATHMSRLVAVVANTKPPSVETVAMVWGISVEAAMFASLTAGTIDIAALWDATKRYLVGMPVRYLSDDHLAARAELAQFVNEVKDNKYVTNRPELEAAGVLYVNLRQFRSPSSQARAQVLNGLNSILKGALNQTPEANMAIAQAVVAFRVAPLLLLYRPEPQLLRASGHALGLVSMMGGLPIPLLTSALNTLPDACVEQLGGALVQMCIYTPSAQVFDVVFGALKATTRTDPTVLKVLGHMLFIVQRYSPERMQPVARKLVAQWIAGGCPQNLPAQLFENRPVCPALPVVAAALVSQVPPSSPVVDQVYQAMRMAVEWLTSETDVAAIELLLSSQVLARVDSVPDYALGAFTELWGASLSAASVMDAVGIIFPAGLLEPLYRRCRSIDPIPVLAMRLTLPAEIRALVPLDSLEPVVAEAMTIADPMTAIPAVLQGTLLRHQLPPCLYSYLIHDLEDRPEVCFLIAVSFIAQQDDRELCVRTALSRVLTVQLAVDVLNCLLDGPAPDRLYHVLELVFSTITPPWHVVWANNVEMALTRAIADVPSQIVVRDGAGEGTTFNVVRSHTLADLAEQCGAETLSVDGLLLPLSTPIGRVPRSPAKPSAEVCPGGVDPSDAVWRTALAHPGMVDVGLYAALMPTPPPPPPADAPAVLHTLFTRASALSVIRGGPFPPLETVTRAADPVLEAALLTAMMFDGGLQWFDSPDASPVPSVNTGLLPVLARVVASCYGVPEPVADRFVPADTLMIGMCAAGLEPDLQLEGPHGPTKAAGWFTAMHGVPWLAEAVEAAVTRAVALAQDNRLLVQLAIVPAFSAALVPLCPDRGVEVDELRPDPADLETQAAMALAYPSYKPAADPAGLAANLTLDSPLAIQSTAILRGTRYMTAWVETVLSAIPTSELLDAWDQVEGAGAHGVGLNNLGATCYMNATLQLLFSIPLFRKRIFDCHEDAAAPGSAALHQLRKLFAFMATPGIAWTDTRPLLQTLVFNGNAVSEHEQQDANEFLMQLEDHLEKALEAGGCGDTFKKTIGLQSRVEMTGKAPCTHRRHTADPAFALSVDVRGFEDLHASLTSLTKAEEMGGDNALTCDECGCKRDTVRRVTLDELPDHLLVHLKRFEFSVETMSNDKIDDRFAFPLNLDLTTYSSEYLARDDSDAPWRSSRPEGYYCYRLCGVIVQAGSLHFGHYYALLKRNGGWVCANDESLQPYDPEKLSEDTFGGTARGPTAYMLLYTRDGATPDPPVPDEFMEAARDKIRASQAMQIARSAAFGLSVSLVPQSCAVTAVALHIMGAWPDNAAATAAMLTQTQVADMVSGLCIRPRASHPAARIPTFDLDAESDPEYVEETPVPAVACRLWHAVRTRVQALALGWGRVIRVLLAAEVPPDSRADVVEWAVYVMGQDAELLADPATPALLRQCGTVRALAHTNAVAAMAEHVPSACPETLALLAETLPHASQSTPEPDAGAVSIGLGALEEDTLLALHPLLNSQFPEVFVNFSVLDDWSAPGEGRWLLGSDELPNGAIDILHSLLTAQPLRRFKAVRSNPALALALAGLVRADQQLASKLSAHLGAIMPGAGDSISAHRAVTALLVGLLDSDARAEVSNALVNSWLCDSLTVCVVGTLINAQPALATQVVTAKAALWGPRLGTDDTDAMQTPIVIGLLQLLPQVRADVTGLVSSIAACVGRPQRIDDDMLPSIYTPLLRIMAVSAAPDSGLASRLAIITGPNHVEVLDAIDAVASHLPDLTETSKAELLETAGHSAVRPGVGVLLHAAVLKHQMPRIEPQLELRAIIARSAGPLVEMIEALEPLRGALSAVACDSDETLPDEFDQVFDILGDGCLLASPSLYRAVMRVFMKKTRSDPDGAGRVIEYALTCGIAHGNLIHFARMLSTHCTAETAPALMTALPRSPWPDMLLLLAPRAHSVSLSLDAIPMSLSDAKLDVIVGVPWSKSQVAGFQLLYDADPSFGPRMLAAALRVGGDVVRRNVQFSRLGVIPGPEGDAWREQTMHS